MPPGSHATILVGVSFPASGGGVVENCVKMGGVAAPNAGVLSSGPGLNNSLLQGQQGQPSTPGAPGFNPSSPAGQGLTAMLDAYRQFSPAPHLAVFCTRLGLSVIDAAGGAGRPPANGIAHSLINQVAASRDGYAAREVLAHNGCTAILTDDQARELAKILDHCALGHQKLPGELEAGLSVALDTSEKVISRALTAPANAWPDRRRVS